MASHSRVLAIRALGGFNYWIKQIANMVCNVCPSLFLQVQPKTNTFQRRGERGRIGFNSLLGISQVNEYSDSICIDNVLLFSKIHVQ